MPPRNITIQANVLQPGDRFMDSEETAQILHTTKPTLNYWRVMQRGPKFYRHNRSIRYLLSDVTAWATANCVEPERGRA